METRNSDISDEIYHVKQPTEYVEEQADTNIEYYHPLPRQVAPQRSNEDCQTQTNVTETEEIQPQENSALEVLKNEKYREYDVAKFNLLVQIEEKLGIVATVKERITWETLSAQLAQAVGLQNRLEEDVCSLNNFKVELEEKYAMELQQRNQLQQEMETTLVIVKMLTDHVEANSYNCQSLERDVQILDKRLKEGYDDCQKWMDETCCTYNERKEKIRELNSVLEFEETEYRKQIFNLHEDINNKRKESSDLKEKLEGEKQKRNKLEEVYTIGKTKLHEETATAEEFRKSVALVCVEELAMAKYNHEKHLEKQLNIRKQVLDDVQEKLATNNFRCISLEQKLQTLVDSTKSLEALQSQLNEEMVGLQKEVQDTTVAMEESTNKFDTLKERLSGKLLNKEKDLKTLQEQFSTCVQKKDDLQKEIHQLHQINTDLELMLTNTEKRKEELVNTTLETRTILHTNTKIVGEIQAQCIAINLTLIETKGNHTELKKKLHQQPLDHEAELLKAKTNLKNVNINCDNKIQTYIDEIHTYKNQVQKLHDDKNDVHISKMQALQTQKSQLVGQADKEKQIHADIKMKVNHKRAAKTHIMQKRDSLLKVLRMSKENRTVEATPQQQKIEGESSKSVGSSTSKGILKSPGKPTTPTKTVSFDDDLNSWKSISDCSDTNEKLPTAPEHNTAVKRKSSNEQFEELIQRYSKVPKRQQ